MSFFCAPRASSERRFVSFPTRELVSFFALLSESRIFADTFSSARPSRRSSSVSFFFFVRSSYLAPKLIQKMQIKFPLAHGYATRRSSASEYGYCGLPERLQPPRLTLEPNLTTAALKSLRELVFRGRRRGNCFRAYSVRVGRIHSEFSSVPPPQ